jgi:hypothetical protein
MPLTRRDMLKAVALAPALAATVRPAAAAGGIRLYPSLATPRWWTGPPLVPDTWTYGSPISMGATLAPDGSTAFQDLRNTPRLGPFTRAYFQMSTPPLTTSHRLDGTVSAAIHALEGNRRIDAVLALQVVVYAPDSSVRGVALPVSADAMEFTLNAPARTRIASAWPLTPIDCEAGDVVVTTLGVAADNQTRSLAYLVGFSVFANQAVDILTVNAAPAANTWVEFSNLLPLVWP